MIRFIPLGGFLGAGKTTTMIAAGKRLEERGERVAIVTNDQGVDLVDTQLAKAAELGEVQEVTGGCFCCRFDDLAAVVKKLEDETNPTVVLAEAVGSCTDLQSTVVRPLRKLYGASLDVSPLVVLVDPIRYGALSQLWARTETESDLAYLYRHQLDEADVIAVNKADLLAEADLAGVTDDLRERFPHAQVISLSAATGAGLDELLAIWTGTTAVDTDHRAFAVDYDRYGAAEAELAWTNQTFDVSSAEPFVPADWVDAFLAAFTARASELGATIGHVKIRLQSSDGTTKASLTSDGAGPSYDEQHWIPATDAHVTLNARVKIEPDGMDELIAQSVTAADTAKGTSTSTRQGDIFKPGFPVPVHRM